jgi:uncharacterized protein YbbK (DUF523 family)
MKLVSACLVGVNCRYNGKNRLNKRLFRLFKEGKLISVCPELLGGLPTPRNCSEIVGGTGLDVLNGKARVIDKGGKDVTKPFLKGANEVLEIAKTMNINEAIMKSNSPSCGCGKIYDGTFSEKLIDGDGVTVALLKKNGIKVISEEKFD